MPVCAAFVHNRIYGDISANRLMMNGVICSVWAINNQRNNTLTALSDIGRVSRS